MMVGNTACLHTMKNHQCRKKYQPCSKSILLFSYGIKRCGMRDFRNDARGSTDRGEETAMSTIPEQAEKNQRTTDSSTMTKKVG